MYDVIIVGAGPTGSYIAHSLASLGYKIVVFEEHERVGEPMHCTGIIGAECIERFPIFDGTVIREVSSFRLFSPSLKEMDLRRDSPQAYIIDRTALDCSLAEKAQQGGALYHLGSRVNVIEVLGDRVRIETDGKKTYDAKTVVIACGFHSRIPQMVGLGKVDDLIMGAQAEVSTNGHRELEVYLNQQMAPGFFSWFVPTFPERALVGLFSRQKPSWHLRMLLDKLCQRGRIASPEAKITYRGIPLKPLAKTYRERVIVVGDAAGQVKPTTGGGVYYGLLCAEVAAHTLYQALSTDTFSEKFFSSYQKAWQDRIGWELQIGYVARRLYDGLSNDQVDHLFNITASNGIHESLLQSADLSFDWHGKAIIKGLHHLGPIREISYHGRKS